MEFFDKTLICRDCKHEFLFTVGEQEFYKQKGLLNQPARCPECRNKRKQLFSNSKSQGADQVSPEQNQEEASESSGTGIIRIVKEVSNIVCAECGKTTTVPFRPRHSRPVYCGACFSRQRAGLEAEVSLAGSSLEEVAG